MVTSVDRPGLATAGNPGATNRDFGLCEYLDFTTMGSPAGATRPAGIPVPRDPGGRRERTDLRGSPAHQGRPAAHRGAGRGDLSGADALGDRVGRLREAGSQHASPRTDLT